MWPTASRRQPLTLSGSLGDAFALHSRALWPRSMWYVVSAAAWPRAMQAPHTGSKKSLKWTAAGNKLSYLDHLAAPCGLQRTILQNGSGTLDTGFCVGLAEDTGFETGVRHSPRSCSTWKNHFPLEPASASRVWLSWWQAAEPLFFVLLVWLHYCFKFWQSFKNAL